GVKQFNLHQVIKKVVLYGIVGLLSFFIIGAVFIVFLNASLSDIQVKKDNVEAAYTELRQRNADLRNSITITEERLNEKKNELDVVTDRLNNIETLIGLTPTEKKSLAERAEIAQLTSEQMAALFKYIPSGSPIEYKGITSKFGYRTHPTLNRREFHRGSDMRAAMNTPVYATADGVIEYGAYHKSSGYGNLVILDHNYGFKTLYGHLKKVVVKSGVYVKKGDLIAYTGNSGMSSGPHLHYEIRFIQRALNPFWFIKWDIENYRQIFEKEKQVPWQSLITAITIDNNLRVAKPTTVQPSSQKVLLSRAK
ncbi:MAG: M23 family metallopeptidase, partial [Sulfurimonadaceae bacterium]|nr:M23 family metallopeptidase [Sulfurimonadaceae bacterium]